MLDIFLISSLPFYDGESLVSAAVKTHQSVVAQLSHPVVTRQGLNFQMQECRTEHSDLALRCDFLIANTQPNRVELYLYRRNSKMFDGEGNEIASTLVQLGSRSDKISASTVLPVGVPVKGSVFFSSRPQGGFRLIELGCYVYQMGPFSVEFRASSRTGATQ